MAYTSRARPSCSRSGASARRKPRRSRRAGRTAQGRRAAPSPMPASRRPRGVRRDHGGNARGEPPGQLPRRPAPQRRHQGHDTPFPDRAVSGRYYLSTGHHDSGFGLGVFLTKQRKVPRVPLWAEEHGPRVRHLRSARAAGPERRGRWQSATLCGRKQCTSVRCHGSARSHCCHRAGACDARLPRARLGSRCMPLAGTRDSPAAEGPQPAGACDQRDPGETCGMNSACGTRSRTRHLRP